MPQPDTLAEVAGRWPEILAAIGGVSPDLFTARGTQEHPCPACLALTGDAGQTRFRWIGDGRNGAGHWHCSHCGGNDGRGGAGTGLDLLSRLRLRRWGPDAMGPTLALVEEEFLHRSPRTRRTASRRSSPMPTPPPATRRTPPPPPASEWIAFCRLEAAEQVADGELFSPDRARGGSYSRRWAHWCEQVADGDLIASATAEGDTMAGGRQIPDLDEPPPPPEPTLPSPPGDPFRVLGWCADRARVWYQHRETGQIASLKPAAQSGPLLHMAPLAWWAAFYANEKGAVDWAQACSQVIEQANTAGVFSVDRVRGRGAWIDQGRVVWHLGDRVEVAGSIRPLIDHTTAYHYPRLPALDIDPAVAPLTDQEGADILEAVAAMGWTGPLDHVHLLGWCVLAGVGGGLDKRPILQVTSRFGSGKTYTRERVLEPLLAGLAISRSNSSEAGIRQLLRADTLPVVIDESEGEDSTRRDGHLRLARLSFDGAPTDRGTTHGTALTFAVRSSVALIGINGQIANPAERSRTVTVGRQQLPQGQWAGVDRQLGEVVTQASGARLLRRSVSHLLTLRANVAVFRRAVEGQMASSAAARAGDTYGALLAGAHLLTSTQALDDDGALAWMDEIGWTAAVALGEGADGSDDPAAAESRQCLGALLSHEEPWRNDGGTGRTTIRELIDLARTPSMADNAEEARKALGRRGVRASSDGLLVTNQAEPLATIYARTKWRQGGHRARLAELPGVTAAGAQRFPVAGVSRALLLPWDLLDPQGA